MGRPHRTCGTRCPRRWVSWLALVRHKDHLGRAGEDEAVRYLEQRGWQILGRNWRCRDGESDIIARDGRTVVFVEVRTRSSDRFGHPLETITPLKVRRLRRLAYRYAHDHHLRGQYLRIDVIGIIRPSHGPSHLTHVVATP